MSDENVRRGEAAARVLGEQVVQEALAGLKKAIIDQWSATPARDQEAREWVWRHYKVVENFEQTLKNYIETGRFEAFKEQQNVVDKAKAGLRRLVA